MRDEAAKVWAAADAEVHEDVEADLAREWDDRQCHAYDADDDREKERAIAEIRAIEAARVLLGFAAEPARDEDENASDGEIGAATGGVYVRSSWVMPARDDIARIGAGTVRLGCVDVSDAVRRAVWDATLLGTGYFGYAVEDSTDNGAGTFEVTIVPGRYPVITGKIK